MLKKWGSLRNYLRQELRESVECLFLCFWRLQRWYYDHLQELYAAHTQLERARRPRGFPPAPRGGKRYCLCFVGICIFDHFGFILVVQGRPSPTLICRPFKIRLLDGHPDLLRHVGNPRDWHVQRNQPTVVAKRRASHLDNGAVDSDERVRMARGPLNVFDVA